MEQSVLKDSNNVTYANLSERETSKLKELEQMFNKQFECDYYLMVMENNNANVQTTVNRL